MRVSLPVHYILVDERYIALPQIGRHLSRRQSRSFAVEKGSLLTLPQEKQRTGTIILAA